MSAQPITTEELHRFRELVGRHLGLQIEGTKVEELGEVLQRRLAATPLGERRAYLDRLATSPDRAELRAIARSLTVSETYFFRNPDHFRALMELVLPDRMRAGSARRSLRILSAGCASGEEIYTVAMLLAERQVELAGWKVELRGVDVNDAMIAKATQGQYTSWALRETPPEYVARFFSHGALDSAIRRAVSFEERNLLDEDPSFWQPDAFDVMFCRNVTMYFPAEVTRRVITRIRRSLTPGGFLFLGHAETLRGISNAFHLRHTHGTFYYQRREPHESIAEPALEATLAEPREDWFDVIRGSAERVADLAARGSASSPALPSSQGDSPLARALELVRSERHAEALELLAAPPSAAQRDPSTQLLLAVLLTNCGDHAEAERTCRDLLELDELDAGAHHLLSLIREQAGDPGGATEHDRTAAYLDATFAIPRLHLGIVARRAGDVDTARRELGRALTLLPAESAAHILLFGGGFSREALAELCRNELRACGGSP